MATSSQINLAISEADFNRLYPDLLGMYDHFNNPPPFGISNEEFEAKYLCSKLWRLNNVYTVINKDGKPVTFRMNLAQHIVYAATRKHPRVIILKSRQQGISTFWLLSYFDDGVFAPFLNIGLMAQGTDEAITLLERAKFTWDALSDDVKAFANVKLDKDNSKEFSFSNGSTIFIRVSFRSTTLQRLHVSEFGKIANANPIRAKETKTGTLQALAKGNTGVIESTAEGINEFKDMWDAAVMCLHSGQMGPKDFYPVFLSWMDDPDCVLDIPQAIDGEAAKHFEDLERATGRKLKDEQKWFWVSQRRELGSDINQEYPGTPEEAFAVSKNGTYYSRLFAETCVRKGGIVQGLYDPNLELDVYFDLGVDDYCVMALVQWYRGQYRIVGEYWNNGFDLEFYIDHLVELNIDIRSVVFPHDIEVRQAVSGNNSGGRARSRRQIISEYIKLKGLRWNVRTIAKSSVADGIEAVRRMIPQMAIDASCTYLMDCLNNYSKEFDEKLKVWKKTPRHDQFSHGADVLRQIAVGHSESGESKMAIPESRRKNTGFAV